MFPANIINKLRYQYKDTLLGSMRFLKREPETTDRYEEYLTQGPQPKLKDASSNKRNLFDNVDSIDRRMVKIARMYLARSR